MSNSISTLLIRNLSDVFGENDPARRRVALDELWNLYREAGRRAGHPEEKLLVGLHAIGFLGNTTKEAADDFYPGYAHTFTEIGKERGWPPATRAQFDALRGPTGALVDRGCRNCCTESALR